MEVTKDILIQYCELREEIKDLRERIEKDELRLQKIEEEGVVSDTVTGTRKDGTIGSIKITGFPIPEYSTVKAMLKKRIAKLQIMEDELHEAVNAVDMTWRKVAANMNKRFRIGE